MPLLNAQWIRQPTLRVFQEIPHSLSHGIFFFNRRIDGSLARTGAIHDLLVSEELGGVRTRVGTPWNIRIRLARLCTPYYSDDLQTCRVNDSNTSSHGRAR